MNTELKTNPADGAGSKDLISKVVRMPTAPSDKIFDDQAMPAADFRFDAKVASVFDDMVSRSVPFYDEMQRMTCEMAKDFAEPGSEIYDVGCSTGTTLLQLDKKIGPYVGLVGIDNSAEMIDRARAKLEGARLARGWRLLDADIHHNLPIQNASVVTMVLTLQFARPLYRQRIMQRICDGLNKNGCVILIEKLVQEDSRVNRMFIDHYYDFKRRNGYSETEIAKKREALENVLVPYRFEENREMLRSAGFNAVEEFFRWYNFCGIIAVK
ncbi:MAG: carboxy-S-adenosyl-L-methionine synthase CmoA [Rickettsiales bacterium]